MAFRRKFSETHQPPERSFLHIDKCVHTNYVHLDNFSVVPVSLKDPAH